MLRQSMPYVEVHRFIALHHPPQAQAGVLDDLFALDVPLVGEPLRVLSLGNHGVDALDGLRTEERVLNI